MTGSLATGLAGALVLCVVFWGLFRVGTSAGALSPTTTPLGVAVPAGKVADPAVVAAVRAAVGRYRRLVDLGMAAVLLVSWGAALVGAWLSTTVASLGAVVVGLVAYVVARRGILRAKQEQRWFDGEPQVARAHISQSALEESKAPVPTWLYAVSLAVVGVVLGYGLHLYDAVPDQVVAHWGANGQPTRTEPKTYASVLMLPVVFGALTMMMFGLAHLVRAGAVAKPGDLSSTPRQTHLAQLTLGLIALAVAAGGGVLTVLSWRAMLPGESSELPMALGLLVLVPTLGVVFWSVRASLRARRLDLRDAGPGGAGAQVDDDRHWKWGFVYVNPDDPAVLVPKRAGIGYTVNAGTVAGKVFYGVTLLVLVASVVLPLVLSLLGRG